MLVRGKSLYEAQCAGCHMADLRGSTTGPNLLRSGVALADQHGELVGAAVAKHTPALTPVQADVVAMAEYIHSIHATMGGQGGPPGRGAANIELNVLVGDAKAGETQFATLCSACHSVTGNLKGIGSKFTDARALQNGWVAGSSGTFGGGGGRGGGGRGGRGGGGRGVNPLVGRNQIDPLARQLNMRGRGQGDLIAFLRALDDPNFDRTIPDRVPSGLAVGGRIER